MCFFQGTEAHERLHWLVIGREPESELGVSKFASMEPSGVRFARRQISGTTTPGPPGVKALLGLNKAYCQVNLVGEDSRIGVRNAVTLRR